MVGYLVLRIKQGHMDYDAVVAKFPQFKEEIEKALACDANPRQIYAAEKISKGVCDDE